MDPSIARLLDEVYRYLFFAPFVVLPIFLINYFRYYSAKPRDAPGKPRFPIISVALFVAPILLLFSISGIRSTEAKNEVERYLAGLEDAQISIDGAAVANLLPVLNALRTLHYIPAHHSHSVLYIQIAIHSAKGDLNLRLGRQSDAPKEYEVIFPSTRPGAGYGIGSVVTTVFDAYHCPGVQSECGD